MKKILDITLSIVLCSAFLVSCNNGGGSSPESEGPVYLPYDIDDAKEI